MHSTPTFTPKVGVLPLSSKDYTIIERNIEKIVNEMSNFYVFRRCRKLKGETFTLYCKILNDHLGQKEETPKRKAKMVGYDDVHSGIRTHALSDQNLNLAP